MGSRNKENVQFVISHLEGCSGNFLGYLIAGARSPMQNIFRVDMCANSQVLSINGRTTWHQEIESRLLGHQVVVTHNYDKHQITDTFPNAQLIQIYPYTHIGNVLYNVCHKKLKIKLENVVDNYFMDIRTWFDMIVKQRPDCDCVDYWQLRSKSQLETLLGKMLSAEQMEFFDQYWATQLLYELNMPAHSMTVTELIEFWKVEQAFSPWMAAWTIFVYEHINKLSESSRIWSIDNNKFDGWDTIKKIESQYNVS